jgi:diguanylate cyclase (GGDEF)-like protein
VTVLIADVDGLKSVNDRYGHLSGDELIQEVARTLVSSFRAGDLIARLGGDEFGIILHNSDHALTAQAIRRIYERIGIYRGKTGVSEVDLSIGMAVARNDESLTETIRRADEDMYTHKNGKQNGRRRS